MFGHFNRRISSVAGIIVLVLIALAVGLMMFWEHYNVVKQSIETREFYQQELFGKQ